MIFDTIFNFTYRPTLWLSLIPALINLSILIYILKSLPRNKISAVFSLFLLTLIAWQLSDSFVRLADSSSTAEFWSTLLNATAFITSTGLHFVLLYTRHNKIANSRWFLAFNYGISFILFNLVATSLIGAPLKQLVATDWGWLSPNEFPLIYSLWVAGLAFLMLVTLLHYAYKSWPKYYERSTALLLAGGFAVPTVFGVITQIVLPHSGSQQLPIASALMSFFSAAAFIALLRYRFLDLSTDILLENIGQGVLTVNQFGDVIFINELALNLLGFEEEDVMGKSYLEVVKMTDDKGGYLTLHSHPITQVLSPGPKTTPDRDTYNIVKKDKNTFPAIVTSTPLIHSGRNIGAVMLFKTSI